MAQLTISVKVNSGALKTLQKNIDTTISKVGNLNNVLSSIGAKINNSGFKSTEAALSNLMNNARQTQSGVEKIAQNVNTNGLNGIDAILAHISNQANAASGAVGKIGQDVSAAGLDAIDAKLAQLVKTAQATQSSIAKMGTHVDSSGVDALGSKIDGLSSQISGQLGGAFNTVLGAIGGKSLSDLTIFNAMDKEVNKVLVKNLGDSTKQATSYWNTIDKATDNALVSMRQAVPAINAIQRATQVSGTEMESASGNVIAFGSYIQSLTGSSALAESAMFNLSKGIKGAYASLDQYGITEESLKATGKWKGDEKDVKGFTDAVVAATGALEMQDQLMNTSKGKLTQIYKQLSVEGAKAGADILSALQPVIDGFISLNKAAGGIPAKLVIIGAAGLTGLALLSPLLSSLKSIGSFFGGVGKVAPAMGKGAGSMNLMAKYMQIGSMGIQQMVVPMLKIAVVVAIALPVAAALAAEAMVLLKLLQMLFKALAFDKIDIGKSVDSIFDLAKGFAGMALAFGALTVVNVANVVYTATGGILNTALAMGQFMANARMLDAALQGLSNLKNITAENSNKITMVANALKQIGVASAAVSDSMGWFGEKVIAMADVANIRTTVENIANIAKGINEVQLPSVDATKANAIKLVSDSLGNIKKASDSVADSMGWFGEKIISVTDVSNVRTTVENISNIAAGVNEVSLTTISADKANTIKVVSDVLNNIKTASNAVAESMGWFGEKIITVTDVGNIGTTVRNIANITGAVNDVPFTPISSDKVKSINTVKTALESIVTIAKNINENAADFVGVEFNEGQVKSSIDKLYSLNQHINSKPFASVQAKVAGINTIKAALDSLANIGKVITYNLTAISNINGNGTQVTTAVNSLYSINQSIMSKPFVNVQAKVGAINSLRAGITALANIGYTFAGSIGAMASISGGHGNVISAVNSLYSINQSIMSKPFVSVQGKIAAINTLRTGAGSIREAVYAINSVPAPQGTNVQKAVTTIKKAMDELNKLTGKKLSANISGIATTVTNAISKITSALNQGSGVQPAARNLGTKIGTGLKSGTSNLRSVASSAIQAGVSAISGKAGAARSAGHSVGAAAVAGFKAGLNSGSPGDIARIMEKEIGTYVPQLTWRQAPAVAAMMVRVSKEAVKAAAKGMGVGSPGDIAKLYKAEVGKYIPMMISAGIPAVKQALQELGKVGTTEVLKGLKLSDIFGDKNQFRIVSNYFMDVVSKIQEITKKTVASKSATQTYVQAWIDGANKIIEAEKKVKSEFTKTNKSILAMKNATSGSGKKKKKIFDSADLNLLKAINAETTKATNKFLKLGKKGADKGQYAAVAKVAKSTTTALKQLRDTNYANDSEALNKLWKAYDVYYKKLDKAEKKKAKSTIDNIKKTIKEQQTAIKTALSDMKIAANDIVTSALIEKDLRAIVGSEAEIKKYSDAVLAAQKKYDDYVFSIRKQGAKETDSQYLTYTTNFVNQSNTYRAALEKQQLYLDEAIRKAEEYAMAMDSAADSTSALGDTKEDLMALAKSFNNLNKNTVDLNLNMSGAIDLLSNDPRYAGLDKNRLSQLILDVIKKELLS